MTKVRAVPMITAMVMAAFVAGACSSSKSSSSAATATTVADGNKTAFCAANSAIDAATFTGSNDAALLAVFKANQANIDIVANDAPSAIKADSTILVTAARAAIAKNDLTPLKNSTIQAAGGRVDTYCGVQGDGTPIPANAGAGKGTAFCNDQAQLDQVVQGANDGPSLLVALKANVAKINDFEKNTPSAVKADAQVLVAAARAAIATNSADGLQSTGINSAALHVDTYCGISSGGPGASPSTTA
ncbi:MAG: hypothetical protein ACYDH6_10555 [Acidimicrobiales bacterium]